MKTHRQRAEEVASILLLRTDTYRHEETGEERTATELIAQEMHPTELLHALHVARERADFMEMKWSEAGGTPQNRGQFNAMVDAAIALYEAEDSGLPPQRPLTVHSAGCHDCGRPYGDEHGFPDLIIPNYLWRKISPTADEGGLLCPSCICMRLHRAGVRRCPGSFMSGPIKSVDPDLMDALRWTENLREQVERNETP